MANQVPAQAHQPTDPANTQSWQSVWRTNLLAQVGALDKRARDLIEQGNQRRLIVRVADRNMIDLPLTAVVVLSGVGLIVSPLGVVAATVAAALSRVEARIES